MPHNGTNTNVSHKNFVMSKLCKGVLSSKIKLQYVDHFNDKAALTVKMIWKVREHKPSVKP
jgi:hypothetical protein